MLNVHANRTPLTRSVRAAAVVVVLGVTLPIAGFGAQTYGKISGTISDQSGGHLPDATLTLSNAETRAKHEVRSDRTGQFEFVGLPAGDYAFEAKYAGFATHHDTLTLTAGQLMQRPVTLQVGHLTETVTVVDSPNDDAEPSRSVRAVPRNQGSQGAPGASCGSGSTVGGNIKPPVQLVRVSPQYPAHLRGTNTQGTVVLDMRIGTDGSIRDVRPKTQATANPDLEHAAVVAVSQWQFSPTLLNCVPVEVNMTANVNFQSTR